MALSSDDLRDIVQGVCTELLGLPLEASGRATVPEAGEELTGWIEFTGAWNGVLAVTCSDGLAEWMGAALFGVESGDLAEEEVYDALGEFVNVLGVHVKGRLDPRVKMGIPNVSGAGRPIAPGEEPNDFAGLCDGEPIRIRIRLCRRD